MIIDTAVVDNKKDNLHTRPPGLQYWTLILLRRGTVDIVGPNDDQICVKSPAMIMIRPDTPYRMRTIVRTKEVYVIFRPQEGWQGFMEWGEQLPGCMVLQLEEYGQVFYDVVTEIPHYWKKHDETSHLLAMNALEKTLLLADRINPNTSYLLDWDDRIKDAVKYIENNLRKRISVAELADEVGMSKSHLAHLFRRQTGYSPMHYQQRYRLHKAQQLLLYTNKLIQDIATEVGFVNPYHFSTRFRKMSGQSPTEFRKNPAGTM